MRGNGSRAIAAVLAAALAGCGVLEAPGPEVAVPDAPWPRLVDAPAHAEATGGPDPAEGRAIAEDLRREALVGAARAEALAGPVVPPAEAARLARAAGR